MHLTSYFTSSSQPKLLAQLRACEWGAAKFLTELLEKEQFHHNLGAGDCYFLMAGDQISTSPMLPTPPTAKRSGKCSSSSHTARIGRTAKPCR